MSIFSVVLILIVIVYVIFTSVYFIRRKKQEIAIEDVDKPDFILFFWEKLIMSGIGIPKDKIKLIFYIERTLLAILFIVLALKFGSLAFFMAFIVVAIFFAQNLEDKTIEKAGIKYVIEMNAFLNSYIPSISSGLSNEQAMLKFINLAADEDLFAWWVSKDDQRTIIPHKWVRIVEVYSMMSFNEENGINNSLPIIEEMQQDLTEKQRYFEDYKAKIGEIQPIVISYYFGVPFFLFFSYARTSYFWHGLYGYIAMLALCIMFASFQFCIYKIRNSAVESVF